MFTRYIIFTLLLSATIFAPVLSAAELRVGVVDVRKIVDSSPKIKALEDSLKSKLSSEESTLLGEKQRIQQLEEDVKKDLDILSDEEKVKVEQDFVAKVQGYQLKTREYSAKKQKETNTMLAEIDTIVNDAIKRVAEAEKIDLVLANGVVFAVDSINITDKVIAALK